MLGTTGLLILSFICYHVEVSSREGEREGGRERERELRAAASACLSTHRLSGIGIHVYM
jgi:hypothetical protein